MLLKETSPITIAKFDEGVFGMLEGTVKNGELCRDGIIGTVVVHIDSDTYKRIRESGDRIHAVLGELYESV